MDGTPARRVQERPLALNSNNLEKSRAAPSIRLLEETYGARPITLYSCSSGAIPRYRVTSAYSRPIESCSDTVAILESTPPAPMLTVADRRSPEPSHVSTRTFSSGQGAV